MLKVILRTAKENGHELVHIGSMPPFMATLHPKVILWGNRVFQCFKEDPPRGVYEYEEVFSYVLVG